MEIQTPDWAGYDRAITVFAPDGRLVQVEYAHKAVDRAKMILGVVFKDGVILMADNSGISPLHVPSSYNKISKVDDHLAMVNAGVGADGRVLIDRARIYAQRNRIIYGEPLSPKILTKKICDELQRLTQLAGLRPYGVAFFVAGIHNKTPTLFEAEPSGVFWQIYAGANGRYKEQIEEFFMKNYKKDVSKEEAIKLSLEAMKRVLKKDFDVEFVEAVVLQKDQKFKRITPNELKKLK